MSLHQYRQRMLIFQHRLTWKTRKKDSFLASIVCWELNGDSPIFPSAFPCHPPAVPFYSRVVQSTETPDPMASQRHRPLSSLQLVTRLFFSQTQAAREAGP